MFYEIKEYFCTIKAWKYGNKTYTKLSFVLSLQHEFPETNFFKGLTLVKY